MKNKQAKHFVSVACPPGGLIAVTYNFTTKPPPQKLNMKKRTQVCDTNVIRPAISPQNQYHKTQKWGIEPK